MAIEAIFEVKTSEREAEQIVAAAREKARQAIEEAQQKALMLIENTIDQTELEQKTIIELMERNVDIVVQDIHDKTRVEIEALQQLIADKVLYAAEFIVKGIVDA